MNHPATVGPQGALAAQMAAFRQKFGRAMSIHDPLFFDSSQDSPHPMPPEETAARWDFVLEVLADGGARPEVLYAARKTRFLVSPSTRSSMSAGRVSQWDRAVAEYRKSKAGKSRKRAKSVAPNATPEIHHG